MIKDLYLNQRLLILPEKAIKIVVIVMAKLFQLEKMMEIDTTIPKINTIHCYI